MMNQTLVAAPTAQVLINVTVLTNQQPISIYIWSLITIPVWELAVCNH